MFSSFSNAQIWTFIQCIMFCMMSHTHFCPAFVIPNITQFKKIIFCHYFIMLHLLQPKPLVLLINLSRCMTHLQSWNNHIFNSLLMGGAYCNLFEILHCTPSPSSHPCPSMTSMMHSKEMYAYIITIALRIFSPSSSPMLSHWKRLENQKGFAHEMLP